VFDIVVAIAAIVFTLPLLVIVAICVRLGDGGPVLFAQERIGRGGLTFRCLKFRTMVTDAEQRLAYLLADDPAAQAEWNVRQKLTADPRITRIGSFLRRSSLDELPQFFNVLQGDMGIVGPRPIVSAEAPRYGRRFVLYCSVRPGITGLWQIRGRSDVSYRRRVALDSFYAPRKRLLWDIQIVLLTIPAVLFARGSY
jgi:lipopolysaccharide/colanic/teichoic acid biosynthesis glycosyltransferase